MKRTRAAAALVALCALPAAGAPPPVITGANVSPIVSTSKNTITGLTLYGRNFWPSGPNDPNRRLLNARRQGGAFQKVLISGISDTELNISLPTQPLLGAPGQLEFQVTIDRMPSNVFAVKVVDDEPRLDSVSPAKITLGGAADDPRWKVWLRGSRWIPETFIWINGANVGYCYQNLNSGQEQFTWPPALRKAGKYSVVLRTEHGPSATRTVEVVAPPTPTPPIAIKRDPLGGAAGAILKATPTPTPRARPLS